MENLIPFIPLKLFDNPHVQSVLGNLVHLPFPDGSRVEHFVLPDGDQLAFEISIPDKWDGKRLVLMIHGLCGSSRSPYMVRIGRKLVKRGFKVVRMNLRTCGVGAGLSRNIYHAGCSDDIAALLRELKRVHPETFISVVGFSLGGNILLKLMGELNKSASQWVDLAIAICPPLDISSSANRLDAKENRLYQFYFYQLLTQSIKRLHRQFPDLPPPKFPDYPSLRALDEIYVVPRLGFKDLSTYYRDSSSLHYLPSIEVHTKILHALDDPIVDPSLLDPSFSNPHLSFYKTLSGGHNAWLGSFSSAHGFWMLDHLILKWHEEVSLSSEA